MTGQFSGTDKGNANLTITDGTTTGFGINKITVSAGDLTSASNGEAVIDTSGGGGGGSGVSTISFGSTGLTPNTATTGAVVVAGTLALANGGTGASTASGARSNLGLGTIATQNSNAVSITGGSIAGITDLAIADGGTGSSTASGARDALGVLPKIADIRDISASIVLNLTDAGKVIFVNNSGASPVNIEVPGLDFTLTDGFQCVIIAYDNSGGAITLTPTDGGTINGSATPLTLTPYNAYTLVVYSEAVAPLTVAKWVAIG